MSIEISNFSAEIVSDFDFTISSTCSDTGYASAEAAPEARDAPEVLDGLPFEFWSRQNTILDLHRRNWD